MLGRAEGGHVCLVLTAPVSYTVRYADVIFFFFFLRLYPFAPLTVDILKQFDSCLMPV